MRFIVDENVRSEACQFLKTSGHDVLTPERGAEDCEIANIAQRDKRIILTHNQHFADILLFPPQEYAGIIRIKIHPPSAPIIINALKDLLSKVNAKGLNKRLVILEEGGFRLR
jgi:predicted nuclease of predicted toxin-antitoxin system